jgi:Flp pilus assembly protein TadG
MAATQRLPIIKCEAANVAVEFALVLPALIMLVVGTVYAGLAVYSVSGLYSAVEAAARCYSINASQCGNASTTQTYAQSQYHGTNQPVFTASTAACGYQVSATMSLVLNAGVASWTIPLSATACYP